MSQANVEVVRGAWERFNRDGMLPEDLFDPDVEVSNVRESPIPGPYRGYDGLAAGARRSSTSFTDHQEALEAALAE